MSIANYESMIGNALRRTILLREDEVVPRVSDLASILPSSTGKIELETVEEGKEGQIIEELVKKAVKKVFGKHFRSEDFASFLQNFTSGRSLEVSDTMPTAVYGQSPGGDMMRHPATSGLRVPGDGLQLRVGSRRAPSEQKLNKKVYGEISCRG
jgi:hypothetical protein